MKANSGAPVVCDITALIRAVSIVAFSTAMMPALGGPSTILVSDKQFRIAGAVFTAPQGWVAEQSTEIVVLEVPEHDSRVAIAAPHSADAQSAVATAWQLFEPGTRREAKLISTAPPRNGWAEHQSYEYETAPNERARVSADAYRKEHRWIVLLFDGKQATEEKRSSQFAVIRDSLQPSNYHRESFAGTAGRELTAERVEEIRSFVINAMQKLGVPGVSLALIDHGHIVLDAGLGIRKLGEPTPVDQNTRFLAASLTKGLTTLLLARLVDQGKITWDEPAITALPSFRLGDDAITRQILVRHLVCACTGLPRQDLEWEFQYKNATPASMLNLIATMQPTSKPGELFQYSNLMAAAAGYAAAHVYDSHRDIATSYDEAMQKLVFDPLQMTSTTFDFNAVQKGDYASPHADDVDGQPALADIASNYAIVPLAPAGGAWTTAHDLIRYVQLELAEGKLPNGEQLVSRTNLLARRKPQVRRGADQSYGMGFTIDTTWGVTVVRHGGSMDGYKSELFFLPDAQVGAVLLTNADNGDMLEEPLLRRVLEVLYDGHPEAQRDLDLDVQSYRRSVAQKSKELTVPADPAARRKLATAYENSALGRIDVTSDDHALTFDFGEWKSTVATKNNVDGTISFVTIDPTVSGFEFVAAMREGKRVLVLRDSQHEYVFSELSQPAYLQN